LIDDYAQRWGIETLFGIFKSRGFNLEDTHLVDSERLSRLFALLTIALCWAYRTGEWLSNDKPILIKTHGRKATQSGLEGFPHRAIVSRSSKHLSLWFRSFTRYFLRLE
jgi:hypothetical protein